MTDLAKAHALAVRLRSGDPRANFWKICADTIEAQADEIERLRAQVVSLQSSLDAAPEHTRLGKKKTPDALEKP